MNTMGRWWQGGGRCGVRVTQQCIRESDKAMGENRHKGGSVRRVLICNIRSATEKPAV